MLAKNPESNIEQEGLLDVTDLVRMFEESEKSTYTARQLAERDRDYVDGNQLTAEEKAALKKRGQPETIRNRIKRKIEYLVGLELKSRIDPIAHPRTPAHEQDAEGVSSGLRYVSDDQDYNRKRSAVWRNMLVEGAGGISITVEQVKSYNGKPGIDVKINRYAWDRIFWDPHSAELDFSDAAYLGVVIWMDYDEAVRKYPDGKEALEATLDTVGISDTYDDKPKYNLWADKKRKRVRICQIWVRRDDEWFFAEYTKGGILKAGPSPYVTDTGDSDCELVFQSAYVDRDNQRYGVVREMIPVQDEINKRASKSLHLLNSAQIIAEEGFTDNIERFRREAARPDGMMVVNPNYFDKFKVETRADLAASHFQIQLDAQNQIDLMGPNATQMGDKAQGSSAASGKAIIASQEGGMIAIGDLLDSLRHLDIRVFRKIWYRIRQFWTTEKWIRITDDERNVKWVGMNVDPAIVQQAMMQDPSMQGKIAGIVRSVAELDCDIIIDEAPDSVTPQLEQFQALVELAKAGMPIPPMAIIKAAPNLRNKAELLDEIEKAQQNAPPDPEVAKAQAQIQLKQQEMQMDAQHQQQKAATDAQIAEHKAQTDANIAQMKLQAEMMLKREQMEAEIQLEREKAAAEIEIERQRAAANIDIDRSRAEHQAKIAEKQAKEKPKQAA